MSYLFFIQAKRTKNKTIHKFSILVTLPRKSFKLRCIENLIIYTQNLFEVHNTSQLGINTLSSHYGTFIVISHNGVLTQEKHGRGAILLPNT
jgi:hypothetical protein